MFSKQVMSKTVSFTNKYSTNELFLGEETRIIPSNFFLVLNGHNFEPREYIFCPFHNLNYHLPSCITVCCLPPPIALDPQYFYLHFRNITNNWAVAFQYSLSVSPTPSKTQLMQVIQFVIDLGMHSNYFFGKMVYLSLHCFVKILFHKN